MKYVYHRSPWIKEKEEEERVQFENEESGV